MTDVHWLTAVEVCRELRAGRISAVEYMRSLLDRIKTLDPRLHAFVQLDKDGALLSAKRVDENLARGTTVGRLGGLPVGIKDIIDVAGLNTTCHSRIKLGNKREADADVVGAIRASDAVLAGKLSTHEFAFGGPSTDLPFPPAVNPWDPARHAGGSSSGSAVGLASGLFPLALGTDTAGSIRGPAGFCGVVGLKPTFGLLSLRGIFPLAPSLDHVGPMARCVEDIALLLDAMTGDGDILADGPALRASRTILQANGLKTLRIGFVRNYHERDFPASDDVKSALEAARSLLEKEGAEVIDISLPRLDETAAVCRILMHSEAWSIHHRWLNERPQDYGAKTRRRLLTGAFHSARDYVDAQRRREEIAAEIDRAFASVDVLLCANAMDAPCRLDDETETARTHPRQARMPFNISGHPAIAMMAGVSSSGLPLSLQFVGRKFEEGTLLGVSASYERATGWNKLHPSLEEAESIQ